MLLCVWLEHGVRLLVWDRVRMRHVVVLYAGDVLVFDGDVEHAGAHFHMPNTRVHVYLDVADVQRPAGYTWSLKVKKRS